MLNLLFNQTKTSFKKAFTLIELIIVIVIIGILSAIVIPNISSFKEEADNTALQGNVRSIQTSTDMYRNQNINSIPAKGIPTIGNPKEVDFSLLVPKDLRQEPKQSQGHYWIDDKGTAWGSFTDIPKNIYFDSSNGEFHFTPDLKASSCEALEYKNGATTKHKVDINLGKDNVYKGQTSAEYDYFVVCYDQFGNPTPEANENFKNINRDLVYKEVFSNKTVNNSVVVVEGYSMPNGIFKIGEKLPSSLTVKNVSATSRTFNLGYSFIDEAGTAYDIPSQKVTLAPNETKTVSITWDSSSAIKEGYYDTYLVLWNNAWTNRIVNYSLVDNVYLYKQFDEWNYFTAPDWNKLDGRTISQISTLSASNVALNDKSISINLPANSYSSGQTITKDYYGYGSYEARMKVPEGDSNLSGMFLYAPNDQEHEIDTEILYRDGKWRAWFTIHNVNHPTYNPSNGLEPGEVYKKEVILDFDPSKEFHNYRLNLYPTYVSFEIDGKEMARWNESFNFKKMQLFTSSFYAHWLPRNQTTYDKQFNVEWIRHGFFE